MSTKFTYKPDYAIHPGETLREKLEELKMLPKEFAVRTSKPVKTISEILNGKSSITPDMAVQFEKVLCISAGFWLKHQANYNEFVAREKHKQEISKAIEWAKQFPYSQMAKLGLVKATRKIDEKAEELLGFFNISKSSAWEDIYLKQQTPVYFRISLQHSKNPYALSVLLQMGDIEANKIQAAEFNKTKLKEILPELKSIMVNEPDDFLSQIQKICLLAGVKVIYTPILPKTVINGTVRWINNNPVIQITDRYKKYDIFWFSLFHELGHIILHGNKKNIFLEEIQGFNKKDEKEIQADNFAANLLLTNEEYSQIINELNLGKDVFETINYFAKQFNTHKDIIIGRILYKNKNLYKFGFLQKEINKIDFSELFGLKIN